VVDVLGPETTDEEREQMRSKWNTVTFGRSVDDKFGEHDRLDTSG
jgi:hypothetical protein